MIRIKIIGTKDESKKEKQEMDEKEGDIEERTATQGKRRKRRKIKRRITAIPKITTKTEKREQYK